MVVSLPINTRALSVFTVSAFPNDREFILPAGTVLQKRLDGVFDVIGIYQKFLNRGDANFSPYTAWLRPFNPTPENYLDQTEGDLVSRIMNDVCGNYNFGTIPNAMSTKRRSMTGPSRTRELPMGSGDKTSYSLSTDTNLSRNTSQRRGGGITVREEMYDDSPMNVVYLDFEQLFVTHDIVTGENEKGGTATFFLNK